MSDHETNTAPADLVRALAHFEDTVRRHLCGDRSGAAVAAARAAVFALAAPVPAAQTPPNDSPRSAEDSPRSPDAGLAAPSQVCAPASPGLERTFPGLAAQGATQEPGLQIQVLDENGVGIHAMVTRMEPVEYSIQADRGDESDDWYIVVTHEDGRREYDGWWRDSSARSRDEVIQEALRGACIKPIPSPVGQAEDAPSRPSPAAQASCGWAGCPHGAECVHAKPIVTDAAGQAEDAARWRKLTSYRTLSADDAHWNGPRRKEDADAWIDGIPARQAVQSEPGDAA